MSKLLTALFIDAGLSVAGCATQSDTRVAADAQQESVMKRADERKQAVEERRDANYKVAIEMCDPLSGPAKDRCVSNAKVQYGKS